MRRCRQGRESVGYNAIGTSHNLGVGEHHLDAADGLFRPGHLGVGHPERSFRFALLVGAGGGEVFHAVVITAACGEFRLSGGQGGGGFPLLGEQVAVVQRGNHLPLFHSITGPWLDLADGGEKLARPRPSVGGVAPIRRRSSSRLRSSVPRRPTSVRPPLPSPPALNRGVPCGGMPHHPGQEQP